jgi:hypothetical protein
VTQATTLGLDAVLDFVNNDHEPYNQVPNSVEIVVYNLTYKPNINGCRGGRGAGRAPTPTPTGTGARGAGRGGRRGQGAERGIVMVSTPT